MAKNGEQQTAARRNTRKKSGSSKKPLKVCGNRVWHSEPEISDERIREATARDWNTWCDLIDAGPGTCASHKEIAKWLSDEYHIGPWWRQAVTVGYERISGLRALAQRQDGSFAASKSRTVSIDCTLLDKLLRTQAEHKNLFPEETTQVLSRPDSKSIRISFSAGVAVIGLTPSDTGKTKINVEHQKLRDQTAVAHWKKYWGAWFDDLTKA